VMTFSWTPVRGVVAGVNEVALRTARQEASVS